MENPWPQVPTFQLVLNCIYVVTNDACRELTTSNSRVGMWISDSALNLGENGNPPCPWNGVATHHALKKTHLNKTCKGPWNQNSLKLGFAHPTLRLFLFLGTLLLQFFCRQNCSIFLCICKYAVCLLFVWFQARKSWPSFFDMCVFQPWLFQRNSIVKAQAGC